MEYLAGFVYTSADLIILAFLGPLAFAFFVMVVKSRADSAVLPPGPRGRLPILGHLFQLPRDHEWLAYRRWSRELGSDVIALDVLGNKIIVLNSLKAVNDLFEKKPSVYSDRPSLFVLKDILGASWIHGLMLYSKEFLQIRKAANRFLAVEPVKEYQGLQVQHTHTCIANIMERPREYTQHFRDMAGRTILGAAYGIELHSQDGYMHTVRMAVEGLNLGLSTRALLYDLLPLVRWLPDWLPSLGIRRDAKRFAPYISALPDVPLRATREAMKAGTAQPSITSSMWQDGHLSDAVIRSVTGSMYLAGTETTVAVLANLCLAMLKYPETQRKAQSEIDSVVGEHRLPDFRDQSSLPYINALVNEVLRWRNVTPLATPHCLATDDFYDGYYLPKGSMVIGNAYAILHDEAIFPEPDTFKPERYLDPSTKTPEVVFGFGGRSCPGRHLARSTVWIAVASLLAAFDIQKALDEHGAEIDPPDDMYTPGVVSFPLEFPCNFVPRSNLAEILMLSNANKA